MPNILVSSANQFDSLCTNLCCLAIIQDTNDQIVTPLVQALNVSLVFYKDVFKIKQKLDMGVLILDSNTSSIRMNTLTSLLLY